ncbi:MAG: hypothetical protein HFH75_04535 [Lachnospiraceae bacterium]|jgi:hypothetical protein|nr:hypothetical protein [Lachnospiraceae bacterium]MDE6940035.1 hypothetical protein [Lachnospiraceae bacterium]MDE6991626.1 hypothetical protein [Lachnospiraceae bacterium]
MVGEYDIEVRQRRLVYKLSIKRNITIILGHSASGKTKLIELIRSYNLLGNESGVTISCDRPCIVLAGRMADVAAAVHENAGSIFFMDEDYSRIMKTSEFAEMIKNADGYFVLVTRDKLSNLPYSANAIMHLKRESRYNEYKPKVTVNVLTPRYENVEMTDPFRPDTLFVEDSKSGFQFFQKLVEHTDCECLSAGGRDNMPKLIEQYRDKEGVLLVIVDGAAFGAELHSTIKALKHKRYLEVYLYMPESFECLLLRSGIVKCENPDVLEHTEKYADSAEYFSWERYFTWYVKEMCNVVGKVYHKSKISQWCITDTNMRKMRKALPSNMILDE